MKTDQHSTGSREPETSAGFPRAELDRMMEAWLEANDNAEREGNWRKYLGPHYTDDAEYRWSLGHKEEFVAKGRRQIEDWALDVQMEGSEGWSYPYQKVVVDEQKGEVIAFWKQIAPVKRPDGSNYEVAGLGGSWFRYAGEMKWSEQEDFFDFGAVMALLLGLAADGHLSPAVKRKIQQVAKGQPLPGHRPLPAGRQSILRKIQCNAAMAKIAMLGR